MSKLHHALVTVAALAASVASACAVDPAARHLVDRLTSAHPFLAVYFPVAAAVATILYHAIVGSSSSSSSGQGSTGGGH